RRYRPRPPPPGRSTLRAASIHRPPFLVPLPVEGGDLDLCLLLPLVEPVGEEPLALLVLGGGQHLGPDLGQGPLRRVLAVLAQEDEVAVGGLGRRAEVALVERGDEVPQFRRELLAARRDLAHAAGLGR